MLYQGQENEEVMTSEDEDMEDTDMTSQAEGLVDLEDLGGVLKSMQSNKV